MKLRNLLSLTFVVLAVFSCKTPTNIAYFQDVKDNSKLSMENVPAITFQPMDQITINVNSRNPEISAMFNMPMQTRYVGVTSGTSSGYNQGVIGYTIDSNGDIDFPILGKIHLAGLTREQASNLIKNKLIDSKQIKDPVVTIDFLNLVVSVMGEVKLPGRYKIDRDRVTILDAISQAGDLTINGKRENVMLIRHNGKTDEVYQVDLTNMENVYNSPAFYIRQGDMIYVTPNTKRARESTSEGNTFYSPSFWISVTSVLVAVTSMILNFTK